MSQDMDWLGDAVDLLVILGIGAAAWGILLRAWSRQPPRDDRA